MKATSFTKAELEAEKGGPRMRTILSALESAEQAGVGRCGRKAKEERSGEGENYYFINFVHEPARVFPGGLML